MGLCSAGGAARQSLRWSWSAALGVSLCPLMHGFSVSALLTFGAESFFEVGGCPVYDRMWSRLSGLGPTDARSTPSPPPAETTKNVSGCCPVPLEVCVVITTPTPPAPPTPRPNLQLSPQPVSLPGKWGRIVADTQDSCDGLVGW